MRCHSHSPVRDRRPGVGRGILVVLAVAVTIAATIALAAPDPARALRAKLWANMYQATGEADNWADVAVGPSHSVYVCGGQGMTDTAGDGLVARYTASGTRLWARTLDGPGSGRDNLGALAVDGSGNLIVCGDVTSLTLDRDIVVAKYTPAGARVWARTLDGSQRGLDMATDVVVDGAGNIYVGGTMTTTAAQERDYAVVKLNPSGAVMWRCYYDGPGLVDSGAHLAIDAGRNTYLTGTSATTGNADVDAATIKVSPSGHRLWARRWDGPSGKSDGGGYVVLSGGNLYVAGWTEGPTPLDRNVFLVKYSTAGTKRWARTIDVGHGDDTPTGLVADSAGNLVLCGSTLGAAPDADYKGLVAKYSPAGSRRWLKTDADPDGDASYREVVRGRRGSTYACGFATTATGKAALQVVKRKASGGVAWRGVYALATANSYGSTLARDGTSGLYVAGIIHGTVPPASNECLLVKFKP